MALPERLIRTLSDDTRAWMADWIFDDLRKILQGLPPDAYIIHGNKSDRGLQINQPLNRSHLSRRIADIGMRYGLDICPERLQQTFTHRLHDQSGQDLQRTQLAIGTHTIQSTYDRLSLHPRFYRPRHGREQTCAYLPLSDEDYQKTLEVFDQLQGTWAKRDRLLVSLFVRDGLSVEQARTLQIRTVMDQGLIRRAIVVQPLVHKSRRIDARPHKPHLRH